MIDRVLKSHLEPIARDHRKWQLLRTLAVGWLAAAFIGLLFILLRAFHVWSSPWVFLLLLAATPIWSLVIWTRNRQKELDCRMVARNIEAENPELHALLMTAIEQTPDRATGELNYLQERVIKEALARDSQFGWHARTLNRLALACAGSGAALVLLLGVMAGLYRSAPPGSAFQQLASHGVTVTPGDASIEKGSSLVVLARFEGTVPGDATLIVRPANEPERRIPLVRNLNDPVFGTSLSDIKNQLTYRIEYASQSTREFKVTTYEYPRLERADAKLTFPGYTGLPAKTIQDTRRVSAVEGSSLDYTFYLNKVVKSAVLVEVRSRRGDEADHTAIAPEPSSKLETISLLGDAIRSNVYSANIPLVSSRRYELLLVDDAGRTNKLPPLFVLDVLTNRVPNLAFIFPKGDQRVSPLEEISFSAEASDDFGLKAYGIAYNLAGQETKVVELGHGSGPNEKRGFNYQIALEKLGAQPDQLLSYYLWADDIGPDGKIRRTTGDMFFAEVRPFDEIFREAQTPSGGQQQQGQQQQGAGEQLAELQKQIISATWNLQRRENAASPSQDYKKDTDVVKDSQDSALQQARSRRAGMDDPRMTEFLDAAEKQMTKAANGLADAAKKNSLEPLPSALSAEQSAYQSLLHLAAREYQVAQNQSNQGGRNSRGQRAQRQIDQLDLKQSDNRYETQSQAASPVGPQQREQLQAFSRLKELAQRQQDVNDRLKDLQAALQEAKTDAERQDIRDRLKRLQEEQRQLLADADELRQRMDRPENQTQMSEARQQLDQTRPEIQQAAQEMQQGSLSQALSSGTRAQRQLQQLRDDFRKQTSSRFADDMRQLRSQARDLAQKENDIGQKLDALNDPAAQKSLTDSDERQRLASQLDQQTQRMDDLVKHATDITQQAEQVEPLLSRQLYDTIRKSTQDNARDLQQTTDDLISRGRLYRSVYEQLKSGKDNSKKAVEVASDLLRGGFPAEAGELEQHARRSINDLKDGVESAAQSVVGDDTDALRFAQRELDDLSSQLEREIAQAHTQAGTNASGALLAANAPSQQQESENAGAPGQDRRGEPKKTPSSRTGQQQDQQSQQNQPNAGSSQSGQAQNGEQPGQAQSGQSQSQAQQEPASANQRGDGNANPASSANAGGRGNFFDQVGGRSADAWGGPITGTGYAQWSDRLRDIEEVLDVPDLRDDVARIRDRARAVRLDLRNNGVRPKWDLVQTQIAGPLIELRSRINDELARRDSKEALVPIDRDPVPARYSELVRRYYEELGKSDPKPAPDTVIPSR